MTKRMFKPVAPRVKSTGIGALKRKLAPVSPAETLRLRDREKFALVARRDWKAYGTGLFQKCRDGRWLDEPALVAFVDEKLKPAKLGKKRRIPKRVAWSVRGRRYVLRTDVLSGAPQIELQASACLGPGDAVAFQGRVASVGAALVHPRLGFCITTAGHLFGTPNAIGRMATIRSQTGNFSVRVGQCRIAQTADYALLTSTSSIECANFYTDSTPLGPVHVPTPSDLGRKLFVLDGFKNAVPTVCRGIDADISLPNGRYRDLIVTDACTVPGQSGGTLIDEQRRIWGFVLGTFQNRFTIYLPAALLIAAESARLA